MRAGWIALAGKVHLNVCAKKHRKELRTNSQYNSPCSFYAFLPTHLLTNTIQNFSFPKRPVSRSS